MGSVVSDFADEVFESSSIAELLAHNAEQFAEAVALRDSSQSLTYGELYRLVNFVARSELGDVQHGDRVAIWAANSVRCAVLALAVAWRGGVTVPLNTRYRASDLEHGMSLAGCKFLYLEPQVFSNPLEAIADETLATAGEIDRDRFPELRAIRRLRDWATGSEEVVFETSKARPDDPLVVFFTSGSSGAPKAMVHSHGSVIRHAHYVARRQQLHGDDVLLLAVPFSGSFGYLTLIEGLTAGAAIALTSESAPKPFAAFVAEHRCTVANITDAYLLPFILGTPSTAGASDSGAPISDLLRSVRAATGGVFEINPDTFTDALAALGITFSHAYGMSEVHAMTYFESPEASLSTRATPGGPAVSPGTESRVIDSQTGDVLESGSLGILEVRGPVTIPGYVTSESGHLRIHDPKGPEGWLYTGDLAVLDAEGRMEFRGRSDHAMRLRGFLVTPGEIESHILTIPGVNVCKVVGVQGARGSEAVALIESEVEEGDALVQQCLDYCRARLADYKVPAAVFLVEGIPRIDGSTGKKIDVRGAQELAKRWLVRAAEDGYLAAARR